MKQTMKSKASDQCSKGAERLVSSTKGTAREFDVFRSMLNKFKLQSMNQHENNFNLGPLTVFGFKGGSCSQVILPVSNRTPVKPAAKGEHRLKANSGIGLSEFGYLVSVDGRSGKFKQTLNTHDDNRDFLCQKNNLQRAPEGIDTTEFRRQRNWLSDSPEKIGNTALNACIYSFTRFDRVSCIYLGRRIVMPCEAVNTRLGRIASKITNKQKPVKIPFRWRKSMHLEWPVVYSNRRHNQVEISIEIHNRFSWN
jgi:hypothetical protein